MPCSMEKLTAHGQDIALYIISASHHAAKPVAELDVMLKDCPDTATYVSGILSQMSKDTTRDVLINQSNLRFFILNPGDVADDHESLCKTGESDWPEIKKLVDGYFGKSV